MSLGGRFRRTQRGEHRTSGSESLIVLIGTATAAALALARDVAVGRELGLGDALDVWTVALTSIGFAASAVSTATSATVVPTFRMSLNEAGNDFPFGRSEVASTAVSIALATGLTAGLAVFVAAGPAIEFLLPADYPRSSLRAVLQILAFTAVPGLILRTTCGSLLQAAQRFWLTSLSSAVPAIAVLAAVILGRQSVNGIAIAHSLGSLVESTALIASVAALVGITLKEVRFRRDVAQRLMSGIGPAFVSGLAFSINPVIDLIVAARLGPGEAGRVGLASRLTLAVAALGATALAVPAFPRFVDALSEGGTTALRSALASALRRSAVAAVALAGALAALAIPLTRVIFTGSEIAPSDARAVAELQLIYALAITPYVLTTIALRAVHALGFYRKAMVVGLAGSVVNIIADIMLSEYFGAAGIALATGVVYSATALWMVLLARSARQ